MERVIRVSKRENPFVMVDKWVLSYSKISWKAKGVLCYLLSKPDDWIVRESDIVKQSKDGRDSVRAALKELEEEGFIERIQLRDEKGRITGVETRVYERPSSADGKSVDGFPNVG